MAVGTVKLVMEGVVVTKGKEVEEAVEIGISVYRKKRLFNRFIHR